MKLCAMTLFFLPLFSLGQTLHFPDRALLVERIVPGTKWLDPFSANADPASLSGRQEFGIALYSELPYGLKELARHQLAVTLPVKRHTMGLRLKHQGGALYRKTQFTWGMGQRLGRMDLGIQLHVTTSRFSGYSSKQFITPSVALGWRIKENWILSLQLNNFFPLKRAGVAPERIAMEIRSVSSFIFSENVAASVELNYLESLPPAIYFNIYYQVISRCAISAGYESRNGRSWIRAGWTWRSLQFFTGNSFHPQLGRSHSLGLIMCKTKNEVL